MHSDKPLADFEDRHSRALFISDVHLGSTGCQAEKLLTFLKHHDADTIYLIGDIVDGWRLKKVWFWPQFHNDVVQKLLRKARKGTRIIYVPGNHDEFLRDYVGHQFGGIEIMDRCIHESVDGSRFLVIHGDQFDLVVRHAKWLALLGDWAYEAALWSNTWINRIRRRLGFRYWSLSNWAKFKVKNAVNFIGNYEEALAQAAAEHELDGVICGHIHHATISKKGGIRYINTGDWVESCTAIVENEKGEFELISWADEEEKLARRIRAVAALRMPDHKAARAA